jgi:hypothetical protein
LLRVPGIVENYIENRRRSAACEFRIETMVEANKPMRAEKPSVRA